MSQITEQQLIEKVSQLVNQVAGIQLGPKQAAQVHSKITQRMRKLSMGSVSEYASYLESHLSEEREAYISLLTTHHTFFFRESYHFDFLAYKGLPKVIEALRAKGQRKIRIWSAACSTGQEAYSLSMLLAHHLPQVAPDMTFEIIGTDIDPESVSFAKNGVFRWEDLKAVPNLYLQNHWVRGTEEIRDFVKAKSSLKQHCQFQVDNLIDLKLPRTEKFDFIFCRNVFIYFAPDQIRKITARLLEHLNPHGYLMIGHSESLSSMGLPVQFLGQSVYTPASDEQAKSVHSSGNSLRLPIAPSPASKSTSQSVPVTQGPLRVFCVDDSGTVLTLLKRILAKEHGFEVVGTASNGAEAYDKLKNMTVDVMTLDIHMPEQNGLEYLKAHHHPSHPPVVMVSSVSRDDADLAFQCLQAGAFEYIEKPTVQDMDKIGQEIRTKLRSAFEAKRLRQKIHLDLDEQFKRSPLIVGADKKLRLVITPYGSLQRVFPLLKNAKPPQPPSVILLDHPGPIYDKLVEQIRSQFPGAIVLPELSRDLLPGAIYYGDLAQVNQRIGRLTNEKTTAVAVLGSLSEAGQKAILSWSKIFLVLEDGVTHPHALAAQAGQIVPATSILYETEKFLSETSREKNEPPKSRAS